MTIETTPGLVFGPVPSRRLGRSLGSTTSLQRCVPIPASTASFVLSGPIEQDLLDITAVHPMREEAVRTFLARARVEWSVVQELPACGQLVQTEYQGQRFYLRRFSSHET